MMKKTLLSGLSLFSVLLAQAQPVSVTGPDGLLRVTTDTRDGRPVYSVTYRDKTILEDSPLGFVANVGDFTRDMTLRAHTEGEISDTYTLDRSKTARVDYHARTLSCTFATADGREMTVAFRVSNNDVAFRYELPKYGDTGSIVIQREATGFDFPDFTTTFLCPQSDAMIGWKRTKPSYEEEYKADAPLTEPSQYGHGFTFPCLFHVGDNGWALVSETDVDSRYCASHLSDATPEGLFTIAFPMPEENNGNGTATAAFALPGHTPWRTLTVGDDLRPIVETTVPWDVVTPRYTTEHRYQYGRGTWSWILWQDNSINMDDQKKFVDLAAAMHDEYVLVDNWWDNNIGRERMPELIDYAHSKGVDVFLWYSSSGYWNDIVQGPVNYMDNSIIRKREMKWLQSIGVKGIKVDFFGGDKQETMRLYEEILSDADDHGLMVIFHGCTLPRGWERMYPNYVGSEAVLASENLIFDQHFCDEESFNACLHPFIRNTVGCMEWGGCFMNHRMNKGNNGGNTRRTTDVFELATTVLYQNPIQNFALAPNNLEDAPALCMDYLREVPTTWDETRFLAGYPGKYIVLARRHGDRWYIAGVQSGNEPMKLKLNAPMLTKGTTAQLYADDKQGNPTLTSTTVKKAGVLEVTLQAEGGFVLVTD
jgi:hypothetical protein